MAINLPFNEAATFFQNKLNIPTRKWDDLWKDQHAKGFMSAGAYKADLLTDLRDVVDKSISAGMTIDNFKREFGAIVERNGWSYNGSRKWRSELIYNTNARQAYNAGRWQQATDPDVLKVMPYIRYRHGDSRVPRPLHLSWDGITLPPDDPWWVTHGPKNGWGCTCYVENATREEYAKAQQAGKTEAPDDGYYTPTDKHGKPLVDPATGKVEKIPNGIDRGWDYNVGQAQNQSYAILAGKVADWPADVGVKAMSEIAAPARKVIETNYRGFLDKAFAGKQSERAYALLGAMEQEDLDFLKGKGVSPQSAGIVISDRIIVGKKSGRHEAAGDALTENEWRNLPNSILAAGAVLYDRTDGKLLYVAPAEEDPRGMKVVVESGVYVQKLKKTINEAVSVFKVDRQALEDNRRYELVRGKI